MLYHCHLSQGQNYKLFNYKIIFHEPNYLGLSFWWFTRGFLAGNFHKLKIEKFKLNWKMLTDKVGVVPSLGKVWIVLHWWQTDNNCLHSFFFWVKDIIGYSSYDDKKQNIYY